MIPTQGKEAIAKCSIPDAVIMYNYDEEQPGYVPQHLCAGSQELLQRYKRYIWTQH
jgi:hypothetical protein